MTVTTGGDDESALSKAQRLAAEKLSVLVGKVVQDGVGPIPGAAAYAEDRLARARRKDGRTEEEAVEAAIRTIIRESVTAAGTTGFVAGLGGLLAAGVAIPASVVGNLAINALMVGAIAHLRGYDVDDPHTRTVILATVAGSSMQLAASGAGVEIGKRLTKEAIKAIPIQLLKRINARAGIFLVAKYGSQRSVITLAKFVPLVGGLVGGSVDATLTRVIGALAKKSLPA